MLSLLDSMDKSNDANTADDVVSVEEQNAERFRETFKYWQANVTINGMMKDDLVRRDHNAKCPYDSSLVTHKHAVLNTSFAIDQNVITVNVGSGEIKQTFYIHEPLLRMHSPVFSACLSRNWAESKKREINLPEDDPKIVTLFCRFLYTSQVHIIEHDTLLWSKTSDGGFHRPDMAGDFLIHSYIFGDKYLAEPFKNACIHTLIDMFEKAPEYSLAIRQNAELLYTKLPQSSPLRRLYVDFWMWASTEEWYDGKGNEYHDVHTAPPEFWRDICKVFSRTRTCLRQSDASRDIIAGQYPWVKDVTQYFEGQRAPESCFPRPFAEDFASLSLQPEPSDD